MSAGRFLNVGYEDNFTNIYPIRIQEETLTFTLNGVANAAPTTAIQANVPSVRVSGSRRAIGINSRLIRFRFGTGAPGNYVINGVLALPVLTLSAFTGYKKGDTGTYTLGGTNYTVSYVGKSPETIV